MGKVRMSGKEKNSAAKRKNWRKGDDLSSGIRAVDVVPGISGLIGKIALISSFALIWAQEYGISNPDFVFLNVRLEILIGSLVTLFAAALYPKAAPAGTLAPLVVLVPVMASFGVHPLILGLLVGILGLIAVYSGAFEWLVRLSGPVCKTSLAFVFGISGVLMSGKKLYQYFAGDVNVFFTIMVCLVPVYIILYRRKLSWMMILASAGVAFVVPVLFGAGYQPTQVHSTLNISPSYWWKDLWGIGYGFQIGTILRTIPFALMVILLWTIDTVSIQAIRENSYKGEGAKEPLYVKESFYVVAIRNVLGAMFGGAQTGSLWRSFLIPLYMVKRPMRQCAVILGLCGLIASLLGFPIQIMAYTPLVWTVLLFGIFMPFTMTAVSNLIEERKPHNRIWIVLFSAAGIWINPLLTWAASVAYEKMAAGMGNQE